MQATTTPPRVIHLTQENIQKILREIATYQEWLKENLESPSLHEMRSLEICLWSSLEEWRQVLEKFPCPVCQPNPQQSMPPAQSLPAQTFTTHP